MTLVVLAAMVTAGCAPAPRPLPPTAVPSAPSTSCASPEHPRPDCTGVADPSELRVMPVDSDGNVVIESPGTVLDGVHVTGSLLIKAPSAVIRNSLVDGTVYNDFNGVANSYTISDSTVGPAEGCISQPGLNDANYTAERVHVRGHDDGFRVSDVGNVTVRDSFARLCYLPPAQAPPDGSHSDGIQAYCPDVLCADVVFAHNTVDARGIPATFMINLNDPHLAGRVSIVDNLLGGGGYTIVTQWRRGPAWDIRGNSVIDGSWAYGAQSAEGTCAHQEWSGNQVVKIDADYGVTGVVAPLPCRA